MTFKEYYFLVCWMHKSFCMQYETVTFFSTKRAVLHGFDVSDKRFFST